MRHCFVTQVGNAIEALASALDPEREPPFKGDILDLLEWAEKDVLELRQQLAAEIMRLEIALRIKTEEHKCCSEDLMKLRESEQSGWKEAAIAWEVCGSIHEAFAKKKDALYSTRHSDFERHAEDARRMLSTESKEKVE